MKKTQAFRGKTLVLEALTFIDYGRKGTLVSLTCMLLYFVSSCKVSTLLVPPGFFQGFKSGSFAKWISASVVKRRQYHFLELVDL